MSVAPGFEPEGNTMASRLALDAVKHAASGSNTGKTGSGLKARITEQFDAVIHLDTTSALQPLEPWSSREADLPETFPTGV